MISSLQYIVALDMNHVDDSITLESTSGVIVYKKRTESELIQISSQIASHLSISNMVAPEQQSIMHWTSFVLNRTASAARGQFPHESWW